MSSYTECATPPIAMPGWLKALNTGAILLTLLFCGPAFAQDDLLDFGDPEPESLPENTEAQDDPTLVDDLESEETAEKKEDSKDTKKEGAEKKAKDEEDEESEAEEEEKDKNDDKAVDVDPRSLDKIKAIPRKSTLRRLRFELAPHASLSLNDAFFQHFSAGLNAVFYPVDGFGIGVGADYFFAHLVTPQRDVIRETRFSVFAEFSQPDLFAHADVYWVPFYGKVSLFNSLIVHLDLYLTAGAGAAMTFGGETSPLVNIGIGQRFFVNEWFAVQVEARDFIYLSTASVNGVVRSDIQNFFMVNVGMSFFVPPSFEYKIR